MGFWVFMLAMDLLVPGIMMLFGWVFLKHPPQDINSLYGYRTTRSMKNQESWDFAQKHCGSLWLRIGIAMFPLTVLAMLFFMGKDTNTVGTWGVIILFLQMIPMVGSIIPVEIALKRKFN